MVTDTTRTAHVPLLLLVLLATPTALSANSATTAIASLATDLGVTVSTATWVATAFGWGVLVGTPLTTALLQIHGPRRTLGVNTALVLFGAAVTAAAPTLAVLLAGRAVGAIGSGGLVTLAISLAGTTRRTGVITASVGLVGAFGPLAGSALSAVSWRLPLLLAALATLAAPALLRRLRTVPIGSAQTRDHRGAALVIGILTAVVVMPRVPGVAIAALAILAAALAAHIASTPEGFVPRAVLRSRPWLVGTAAACALSTVYFAVLYTIPQLLRAEWSPNQIGLATLIGLAAGATAALLFTRWAHRLPARAVDLGLPAFAIAAATLPLAAPPPTILTCSTALAVFASSAGMAWYTTHATTALPLHHRHSALGLYLLAYQLGQAVGPALASFLLA
ncbi:MFS transporter [Nocardia sp. NPDC050406]|uniref:MFS transporter n=1 Tax=Nocardia sp. NPDC050406 TaxID=3364318 RepID=UPI0037A9E029